MNRSEILRRMATILNEKVRATIPGMINCYLIEAPVEKEHGESVTVKITARGLLYNDYLGGVARTYRVNELFHYDYGEKQFITVPGLWERFERIAEHDIEEMLVKLTKMIKEHVEEEKAWKEQQLANRIIRRK